MSRNFDSSTYLPLTRSNYSVTSSGGNLTVSASTSGQPQSESASAFKTFARVAAIVGIGCAAIYLTKMYFVPKTSSKEDMESSKESAEVNTQTSLLNLRSASIGFETETVGPTETESDKSKVNDGVSVPGDEGKESSGQDANQDDKVNNQTSETLEKPKIIELDEVNQFDLPKTFEQQKSSAQHDPVSLRLANEEDQSSNASFEGAYYGSDENANYQSDAPIANEEDPLNNNSLEGQSTETDEESRVTIRRQIAKKLKLGERLTEEEVKEFQYYQATTPLRRNNANETYYTKQQAIYDQRQFQLDRSLQGYYLQSPPQNQYAPGSFFNGYGYEQYEDDNLSLNDIYYFSEQALNSARQKLSSAYAVINNSQRLLTSRPEEPVRTRGASQSPTRLPRSQASQSRSRPNDQNLSA